MKRETKILIVALLFGAFLITQNWLVSGQEMAAIAGRPVKTETKPDLTLTPAEIETGQAIQKRLQQAGKLLTEALLESQTAEPTKDGISAVFWKIRGVYADLAKADIEFKKWNLDAQKAHGCEGCDLQGNKFVKTAETPAK